MLKNITYGSREMNKLLDDTLIKKYGFPSETLMQIAGLAIAQVIHQILGFSFKAQKQQKSPQITVLVGPGNNGGDGLVAARHLAMMKYNIDIIPFKQLQGKNKVYLELCKLLNVPVYDVEFAFNPANEGAVALAKHLASKDLIVDGIFGFPLTGDIRSPYKELIPALTAFQSKILAIDIPSGWDANQGNIRALFTPRYLVSLGMPKKCSQGFKGEHYLGGRFVPQAVCEQLGIKLPQYADAQLFVRLN